MDATLREVHAGTSELPPVRLGSKLDRDLGLDSLARTELLLRIEQTFSVSLPEDTLASAETVADLWAALGRSAAAAGMAGAPHERVDHLPPPAGACGAPDAAATLLEVLAWHVQAHPDRVQVTVLHDEQAKSLTYREIAQGAAAVAAGLQAAEVAPREAVAIMLPTCAEYFSTWLGILLAGAVPVPIYPPARASQLEEHVLRHAALLDNARAVMLVTGSEAKLVARLLQARVPGLRHVSTPQQLALARGTPQSVHVGADDIAFLQYTSGSTGRPKGVVLTHANLLANIRAMAAAAQATADDVFVSWLPLYHDMGLIGAWLSSLYMGFPLVVMSPLAFLGRPLRWLEAVDRWGGTLTAAPNFAYELCLKRIDGDTLEGLDLSTLRLAFNGAEAVSAATVRQFSERFAACGLRPEAMAPVYGLAEASVGLLFPPLGRIAPVDAVQREPFMRTGHAIPAATGDATALQFVGCGRPLPGHVVRILDEGGHEVSERVEGRLEFRGPSATRGYFRNAEPTARLLHDGWLDTGDRAYTAGGDIFITGRVKDIVIRAGRNLYPEQIEQAVGQVKGIRKGCVVVFGSPNPAAGTERLVVLTETRDVSDSQAVQLREAVSRAVISVIGEPPDDIVLAPAHTVLKTSSGKVRRSACRDLYQAGPAALAARSPRRQLLGLLLGTVSMRLPLLARASRRLLFGLYASLVFWLLAPPAWLLALAMPAPARAWAASRAAARALFALLAMAPRVKGLRELPTQPCVLVSNHESYLDGVLLVATLPRRCTFVAKREFGRQLVAGAFLRSLGTVFVERVAVVRAAQEVQVMADRLAAGETLLVFPEGTFRAEAGLLPFHLGAFLAAVRAGVPVVPLVLKGTRAALPENSRWPRHAALTVQVCEPLTATADSADLFARAVRLRDAAHRAIAGHVQHASAPLTD